MGVIRVHMYSYVYTFNMYTIHRYTVRLYYALSHLQSYLIAICPQLSSIYLITHSSESHFINDTMETSSVQEKNGRENKER